MPEPPEVIVGKRNALAFTVMAVIGLAAVTGSLEADGAERWFLWIATSVAWLGTAAAFLTRVRADAAGIEMRRPLLGAQRIAWADVAAVYGFDLAVGTGTTVRSRDGRSIWLSDVYSNRAEIEAAVVERSGVKKA